MATLRWKTFGGIIPKIEARNLPDIAAQTAQNVDLSRSHMQPLKGPSTVQALSDALQQSIYLWSRGGSTEWLSWNTDVDVARSMVAEDEYYRIYWTNGTTLREKYWSGGAAHDVTSVGSWAPSSAPTLADKVAIIDINLIEVNGGACSCRWEDGQIVICYAASIKWKSYSGFGFDSGTSYDRPDMTWAITYGGHTTSYPTWTPFDINYPAGVDPYNPAHPTDPAGSFEVVAMNTRDLTSTELEVVATHDIYTTETWTQEFRVNCNFKKPERKYAYYCYTIVDSFGVESPPSPISEEVLTDPHEVPIINVASTGVGVARLYRSATGSSEDAWMFVEDMETSPGVPYWYYADYKNDGELAEVMPLIESPPTTMYGLTNCGSFFAAFNGSDLYFSEPYMPYSWPTKYRLVTQSPIVGLAMSGNDLIVLTKGRPELISGSHPDILTQTVLPWEYACVSKRSIAISQDYVIFASADGLVGAKGGQFDMLTAGHYTESQWAALTPSSMVGSFHDGRYIGFATGGTIILDLRESPERRLTTTDQTATGSYTDLESDELYLIQSSNITKWRGDSATDLTMTWKSKEYQTVEHLNFDSAKIIAASYASLSFRVYCEGVLTWTYAVTSDAGFRLPKIDWTSRWSLEIVTTDAISEVIMATSMMGLRG